MGKISFITVLLTFAYFCLLLVSRTDVIFTKNPREPHLPYFVGYDKMLTIHHRVIPTTYKSTKGDLTFRRMRHQLVNFINSCSLRREEGWVSVPFLLLAKRISLDIFSIISYNIQIKILQISKKLKVQLNVTFIALFAFSIKKSHREVEGPWKLERWRPLLPLNLLAQK